MFSCQMPNVSPFKSFDIKPFDIDSSFEHLSFVHLIPSGAGPVVWANYPTNAL